MIRAFIPNIDLFKYFQGHDLEKAEKEEETEQLQHRQLQPPDHLISMKQTMLVIQAMKLISVGVMHLDSQETIIADWRHSWE